jgi:hypothetical protein
VVAFLSFDVNVHDNIDKSAALLLRKSESTL